MVHLQIGTVITNMGTDATNFLPFELGFQQSASWDGTDLASASEGRHFLLSQH